MLTQQDRHHETDGVPNRGHELAWTHPCSAWTETVCVVESQDRGPGHRWGLKPSEVRRGTQR